MMITGPKICDSHNCPHGCRPLTGCEGHARRLRADAQTPVLTDEQIDALWVSTPDDPDGNEFVPFARAVEAAVLAAQAPAQPDRAVMQQALDALRYARRCLRPDDHDTDYVDAAITALSATMEKPNG